MDRRTFFSSLAALVGLGGTTAAATTPLPHTDLDRFDITDPDDDILRGNFIPYLDGQPLGHVQKADRKEGWAEVLVVPLSFPLAPLWYRRAEQTRVYGQVQLLRATPDRRRDFEENRVFLTTLGSLMSLRELERWQAQV